VRFEITAFYFYLLDKDVEKFVCLFFGTKTDSYEC
jgi:hypothetical protein